MKKAFLAFELNVNEPFEHERHRAVFYKDDLRCVLSISEMSNLADLINHVKRMWARDHEIVLLDKASRKPVHSGRWGVAKVLKLYS